MITAKSNDILVTATSEQGVSVIVDVKYQFIRWDTLRAACEQSDLALASAYQDVYRQATRMAANGPVVVSVGQDHTNVWWVATVAALHGGGEANYPRCADEGMTQPNHLLAACEAEDICQRLGTRVSRREGFDGPAAKARAARIKARV